MKLIFARKDVLHFEILPQSFYAIIFYAIWSKRKNFHEVNFRMQKCFAAKNILKNILGFKLFSRS